MEEVKVERIEEIHRMTDTEWCIAWENICNKLRRKYPEHIKKVHLVEGSKSE